MRSHAVVRWTHQRTPRRVSPMRQNQPDQPEHSSRALPARFWVLRIGAAALGMALALFALAGWGGVAPQTTPVTHAAAAHFSSGGPVINWDSSMIYAGQNNGNPEGPVGEQAKVNGSGFSAGNDVNVVLAPGDSTFNPATCQSSNDVGIAN